MTADTERYARQAHAFPASRREETALLGIDSHGSPIQARARWIAAACMGIPVLGSDAPGFEGAGEHWLRSPYPELLRRLQGSARWEFLDPLAPAEHLAGTFEGRANAWLDVQLNDFEFALQSLADLGRSRIDVPVILSYSGPGGVVVARCPGAAGLSINSAARVATGVFRPARRSSGSSPPVSRWARCAQGRTAPRDRGRPPGAPGRRLLLAAPAGPRLDGRGDARGPSPRGVEARRGSPAGARRAARGARRHRRPRELAGPGLEAERREPGPWTSRSTTGTSRSSPAT